MGFHCIPSRDVLFIWGQFPVASPSHTGWAFLPRQPRPIGHTHFSVPACDSAFPQLLPAQLNSGGWWGPWRAQRCPPEGRRGRRAEEKGANHPLSADSVESQLLGPWASSSPLPGPGVRNKSPCKVAPPGAQGSEGTVCHPGDPSRNIGLDPGVPQSPGKSRILPEAFEAKQAVFSTPGLCSLPSTKEPKCPASQPACPGCPWILSASGLQSVLGIGISPSSLPLCLGLLLVSPGV